LNSRGAKHIETSVCRSFIFVITAGSGYLQKKIRIKEPPGLGICKKRIKEPPDIMKDPAKTRQFSLNFSKELRTMIININRVFFFF
jgi:hypothetical protein